MALKYFKVDRKAQPGDLVQCIVTGNVYTVEFISFDGEIVVEDIFKAGCNASDFVVLNHYWVLERAKSSTSKQH